VKTNTRARPRLAVDNAPVAPQGERHVVAAPPSARRRARAR
jgi:hypothetical protein